MAYEKGKGVGFDPDRYTSVFAGFAPLSRPRVVAVIVVQEPQKEHYGGHVCGPIFKEVVYDALIRLNVPLDPVLDPDKPGEKPVSPLIAKMMHATEEQIMQSAAFPEISLVEDADVVVSRPTPEDLDRDVAALITPLDGLALLPQRTLDASSGQTIPNLIGMTKSEARESLQRLGILMDAQGAGWVAAQSLPPGTRVEEGTVCGLQFGDKLTGADTGDTG